MDNDKIVTVDHTKTVILIVVGILVLLIIATGVIAGWKSFGRYQTLADERNQIQVNEIRISQQEQLIKVEQQKAEIRVAEAKGIAQAQQIINATLTDKYLQHEAIQSQQKLADSPNHTTIYIPSGQNGIPLVKTLDESAQPTK